MGTNLKCRAIVFTKPGPSLCGDECDGSLIKPFPTIQEALDSFYYYYYLPEDATIILLPGIYEGPNNTNVVPDIANMYA